jgi:putative ATP-dependent endonuclease of the OLD family
MKLKEITIENFRGIRSLTLPFDDLTVLIGENNTGKSTVLEAIRLVLSRGFGTRRSSQFAEYDFHLADADASPQTAQPIKITLHFAEEREDEWPKSIIQQMSEVVQLDTEGFNHIWLRAEGTFNSASSSFETKLAFLDRNGAELIPQNGAARNLITQFVPLFFLSALRDASHEFGQRGQFWSGFLKSIQLPDEKRKEVEQILKNINKDVIGANAGLTEVTQKIADVARLVPLGAADPVVLEAIPTRVFDMVGKIQVHLKSAYGAKLPLNRHGEGTQSLAVLMLFQAFASANLTEAYKPESTPILALEEPEAHLHPSAIRSLGAFLESMTGQIIVSSHSGDLVSRVPVTSLRRLYKHDGETKVGSVMEDLLTDRERQEIDHRIRCDRGHYLFSRCWLLVEGESDFHLIPLLFEMMGHSQDQVSFSVLEFSKVFAKGEYFIKVAKALGIQWFMMADGDTEGNGYIERARNYLEDGENLADRARTLACTDIEHEFWNSGYNDFIERMLVLQTVTQITNQSGNDNNKKVKMTIEAAIKQAGSKPAFAQALAGEVKKRGAATIPQSIQDIINRVVQLSGD